MQPSSQRRFYVQGLLRIDSRPSRLIRGGHHSALCSYGDMEHEPKINDQENRPILLLDYDGAASALSMSRAALRDLVYKGRGPIVTKIGRRTFFAVKDLEAFVDERRQF